MGKLNDIKFLRYNPLDTYAPIYQKDKEQLVYDFIKWSLRGNTNTQTIEVFGKYQRVLYQCSKSKLGEVISNYDVYYDDFRLKFQLAHNEGDYDFIKYSLIEIVKQWCGGDMFYFIVNEDIK